ncbi:MAG: hypothetical protein ACI8RD_002904, partial [Bacillariaceae sp.]
SNKYSRYSMWYVVVLSLLFFGVIEKEIEGQS